VSDAHPLLPTVGFGCAVAVLLVPLLPSGGLAPLSAALIAGLAVGAPLAARLWRQPALQGPRGVAMRGAADAIALLTVATAFAAATAPVTDRPTAYAAVATAWALAWLPVRWLAPGLAGVAVLAALVAGLAGLATGRADTLLQPVWSLEPSLASGAALGLLLPGLLGPWSAGPARRPGDRRTPFAVGGVAALVALGLACWAAGRYGTQLGFAADGIGFALAGLAASAAAASWVSWGSVAPGPRTARVVAGAAASLWLVGPGLGAVPWVAFALLPAVAGAWLLVRGALVRGVDRYALGAAGGALLVGGFLGPNLPDRTLDAVALSAWLVVAFWVVATRTVRAEVPA
jgi:hypothetical protein